MITPAEKKEFGRVLREQRMKAGLSMDQLSASIRVSKTALSTWELGRKIPVKYHERVEQLSKILRCSPALFPVIAQGDTKTHIVLNKRRTKPLAHPALSYSSEPREPEIPRKILYSPCDKAEKLLKKLHNLIYSSITDNRGCELKLLEENITEAHAALEELQVLAGEYKDRDREAWWRKCHD